jgi:molybdenum cofactor synthesis domain-containing protein
MNLPDIFKVKIITLSDRAAAGEYEDLSGPLIKEMTDEWFKNTGWRCECDIVVIPDDSGKLRQLVNESSQDYNVIFTTGGTGIGPRDMTVDVVEQMLEKVIPGIMEHIRVKFGSERPNALLSRGVAGVKGSSLIYTLPGSVRAVREYMEEIMKSLQHAILMLYGIDAHDYGK